MNNQNEEDDMYQCQFIPPTPGVPPVAAAITPAENGSTRLGVTFASPDDVFLGRGHIDTSDAEKSDEESVTSADKREKEKRRNRARHSTSMIIDLDNIPEINVILPLRSIINLMETQSICKSCRLGCNETEYELETFGIANSIYARCSCGHQSSARAILRSKAEEKITQLVDGQSFSNKVNCTDFDLNAKVMLALQLGGVGRQELDNICGMLDLANNPMDKRLTELMEDLGKSIIELGKEVLQENLEIEKSFSPADESDKKLLAVSNDARWDKRGSGRRYDSISGCSVMMGNRSSLVVGLEPMSMSCLKCTSNKPHDDDVCSCNYNGSSKGMESVGALALVKRITKEENECFIKDFVADDDSSCKAILQHSYKESIAAGMMTAAEIPRYNSLIHGPGKGRPKDDLGQLPLSHPKINMLADKGHRNRNHHKPMFSLIRQSTEKRKGITAVDCERYKRRMSYTMRLHTGGSFEEFKTACKACLEHHFDNHEFCADWCKAKSATEEQKKEDSMRFRCKKENKEMYVFMKSLHDKFMDDELLRQLHHQWNTNIVEGFNKLITKFLPKDRTYAKTIENSVRIYLAMSLLSLGYKRFYKRLFRKCGLTLGEYCHLFLRAEDIERQWRKQYRRNKNVKKTRMKLLYQKIREGREKLVADKKKGFMYSTGMMGPNGDVNEEPPKKKAKTTNGPCKHCGKFGHSRRSHSNCDANPKNIAKAREIDEKASVENGGGIEEDVTDHDSDSSISDNEETSSNLAELAEIEEIEALSFDDVQGIKTTKFGFE